MSRYPLSVVSAITGFTITSYRLMGAVQPMLPKTKQPLKIHVWAGISYINDTV